MQDSHQTQNIDRLERKDEKMAENNTIKAVGILTDAPRLVLNAEEWEKKVFETKITVERRSGTPDQLILQIPASVKTKKEMDTLKAGSEVVVVGEIHTKDINTSSQTKARVKIFIAVDSITLNDPPLPRANDVKIAGNICKDPRPRMTPRGTAVTDIIVAVNGKSGSHYIPCICWQNVAEAAAVLKKGDYVEIEGRFQSREYKKKIGSGAPFLMTAYEVSAIQLGTEVSEDELEARREQNNSTHRKEST